MSAATMLTVYIVLLFVIPSAATISALGSLGRPALLWGLLLFFWWALSKMQLPVHDVRPVSQPVRLAFAAFIVLVLVSYASAMFRGQPADQISPAFTAIVGVASWGGVLLVAMDGIRTHDEAARLTRRLAIAGGLMAAFGLAQAITGQTFIDWVASIPGVTMDAGDLIVRETFSRASGTAMHPLEYGTVVVASLPLALTAAVTRGFRGAASRVGVLWWAPVVAILIASLVAVSRSAIIGLAVAAIASLPALPKRARSWVILGGLIAVAGVLVAVPHLYGTLVGLFAGAGDDPSTQSRTNALARLPDFLASSPLIGQGFGTFLPRYYIFDDAWALMLVEVGILGVIAFGALVLAALWSAVSASRHSPFVDTKAIARALAACMLTISVLFAFFDGLSFPMAAGYLFLVAGLCAAMRTIGKSDVETGISSGSLLAGNAVG